MLAKTRPAGGVTPQSTARVIRAAPAPRRGVRSSCDPERRVPPNQKTCHTDRPSRRAWRRNCPVATSSSTARGSMTSTRIAVRRQSVHHAPTAIGWSMTRTILTVPRGRTRRPKRPAIQGMVRPPLFVPHDASERLDEVCDGADARDPASARVANTRGPRIHALLARQLETPHSTSGGGTGGPARSNPTTS